MEFGRRSSVSGLFDGVAESNGADTSSLFAVVLKT